MNKDLIFKTVEPLLLALEKRGCVDPTIHLVRAYDQNMNVITFFKDEVLHQYGYHTSEMTQFNINKELEKICLDF